MKPQLTIILALLIATPIFAQTHTEESGSFALVGDGFSYKFETHYIYVASKDFLRINAYVSASDYGFAQIQIFSYNHQTQYAQFYVNAGQDPIFDDEIYEIPDSCAIHLTVYAIGTAAITYKAIDEPIEIEYSYDDAGNRIQRSIVYLYPSSKKSIATEEQFISNIQNEFGITQKFKVYPNPTNQHIYVALNEEALKSPNAKLILFDMSGKQILIENAFNDIMQIDLSSFPKGVYILKLVYGTSSKESKIIKY